jgi:hypothetical protein
MRSGADKRLASAATLLAAALAGCCNVLVTEPLDTYTTRRQTEKKTTSADACGSVDIDSCRHAGKGE